MIITDIVEYKTNRYKIWIEQEFAFVLYKGELRIYGIELGKELEEDYYQEILHKVLPKRAKMRSMYLLQKKSYTEQQLNGKLRMAFYPEEVIIEAIEYLKSYRYIDDEQYARDYIFYQSTKRSKKTIKMKLLERGIDSQLIESLFEEMDPNQQLAHEISQVKKIIEKKTRCTEFTEEELDYESKQKIYQMLIRKGYSSEAIRIGMDAIGEDL